MTDLTIRNGEVALAASVFGEASAPPLLFLHGMSMSRDTWEELAAQFSVDHQVWTLDFRGHGHAGRVEEYPLEGYISDAAAALAVIGRPAAVVGHSLGACVAGVLAQRAHPFVRGVFLEDPPWYLGDPETFDNSTFPKDFAFIEARQKAMQDERAPLSDYFDMLAYGPSSLGGKVIDHTSSRHILSHASALQRHDNRCWRSIRPLMSTFDPDTPFRRPATIVAGDPRMAAALLEGHAERLANTHPEAKVLRYEGCGHFPHRTFGFDERFAADLSAFLSSLPA